MVRAKSAREKKQQNGGGGNKQWPVPIANVHVSSAGEQLITGNRGALKCAERIKQRTSVLRIVVSVIIIMMIIRAGLGNIPVVALEILVGHWAQGRESVDAPVLSGSTLLCLFSFID